MQNSRLEGLVKTAFHNANESINQSAKNVSDIAILTTNSTDMESLVLDLQYQLVLTQICGDIDTSIFDLSEEDDID